MPVPNRLFLETLQQLIRMVEFFQIMGERDGLVFSGIQYSHSIAVAKKGECLSRSSAQEVRKRRGSKGQPFPPFLFFSVGPLH